jgi:hypothetical protein
MIAASMKVNDRSAPARARIVIDLLTNYALPLSNEKELQAKIAEVFEAAALDFEREVRLGTGDTVDFMVGDLAVEIKIKGARRAIYRQLERYCGYDAVKGIVLATLVPMGLPSLICGKPASIADLSRGWL